MAFKDLSFQEKSTWGSLLAILLTAGWYFRAVLSADAGLTGAELVLLAAGAVVVLVVVEVVYHVVIALWSRSEVETDERDRLISARAGQAAGIVLSLGVFLAIGQIVASGAVDPEQSSAPFLLTRVATAHILVASVAVAQLAEYCVQLFLYRRGL